MKIKNSLFFFGSLSKVKSNNKTFANDCQQKENNKKKGNISIAYDALPYCIVAYCSERYYTGTENKDHLYKSSSVHKMSRF